jgi:hypothetical protein
MAPATGTALLILGAFVLPGFVTLLFRERTYAVRNEDSPFERLLTALYYSALIYVIALAAGWAFGHGLDDRDLTAFYEGRKSLGEYLVAGVVVALVLPAAISEIGRRWAGSEQLRPQTLAKLGIDKGHSTRSSWNEMFSRKGTAMIRVTLKDGRVVGGYYGPGSLSSYSEHDQDLLISQRWVLDDDGWFCEPAPGSLGLWVPRDNIASVELSEILEADEAETPDADDRSEQPPQVDSTYEPQAPTH